VIHHSDQGSQYTSVTFGLRCKEMGARPSMGSVGDCYDDAMCESFFSTLECELLNRRKFKTKAEARVACFEFIEGWYNPSRRHSALGYKSPINYERTPPLKGWNLQARNRPSNRGNSNSKNCVVLPRVCFACLRDGLARLSEDAAQGGTASLRFLIAARMARPFCFAPNLTRCRYKSAMTSVEYRKDRERVTFAVMTAT